MDIAIVGMGVRCAGASSPVELWQLISGAKTAIRSVPVDRDTFTAKLVDVRPHWAGLLEDPAGFDAKFFRISPREAKTMDPQQRLFLEVASDALTEAPCGKDTGVFVGNTYGDYVHHANATSGLYRTWEGFSIANRLSQFMGYDGPSAMVDTACSSSAMALYLACRALDAGDCRAAVVGGVSLLLNPARFTHFGRMGILSPTGQCRPFSAGADGMVFGEGVAAVVLRPLADAIGCGDRVYGVVRGVGVSTGAGAWGFTVPNPLAQAEAIRRAMADARVGPVQYVEAHGTGTPVGDPIEAHGLSLAYTEHNQSIKLGSIKPNIGHTEAAAGAMGLIKVLLQFHYGMLAPTLGYTGPMPALDHRFSVQTMLEPWVRNGAPRRAGVSSFGVGGANVHVIVEEPLDAQPRPLPMVHAWEHSRFWLD